MPGFLDRKLIPLRSVFTSELLSMEMLKPKPKSANFSIIMMRRLNIGVTTITREQLPIIRLEKSQLILA